MRVRLAVGLVLAAGAGFAHDGPHRPATADLESAAPVEALGFPSRIGGPFRLVDQTGAPRSEVDPDGRTQLVFFGYATCVGICSHTLPTLADLADALDAAGVPATPVLITVDPTRDTPSALAEAARAIHPDLVALTGDEAQLATARATFQVESELLFTDPGLGPVYAHGSYIYVLDGNGRFLTLLPPILSVERMVEVVRGYVGS